MATAGNVTAPYQTTGAGGKLRKKPSRHSIPATPYNRPHTAFKNSNPSLLKKLVDPASRLVYAGAHRLFESFRRRPPPLSLQLPLGTNEESHNAPQDERRSDSLANTAADTGISELEQMLQEKTFTRSEIRRLTSLLHSRTTESPSDDSLEKAARDNFHATISTPIVASKVIKEIASPAELAKSYMGSRSMLIQRTPITPAAQKAANSLWDLENGFMTPRSRGRSAMYTMAHTPYTRSPTFSQKGIRSGYGHGVASTSSRLGHEGKMALKRNSSVLDDVIESGGPLRRIRQKANVSSQKGKKELGYTVFQQDGSSQSLVLYNETEPKVSGFASVPAESTQTAYKILQHLEKPSLKEKNKTEAKVSRKSPVPNSMLTLVNDESTGSLKGKAPVGFTDLPSKVQEEPPRKKRANDYTVKIDDDVHDNGCVSFSLVKINKPESSIADIIKTPSPPEVSKTHTLVENNNNLMLPEIAKVTRHAEVIHSSVLPQSTLQTENIAPEKDLSSLSFVKTAENATPVPFSANQPSELKPMSSSDPKTNYSTSVNGNDQKSTGGSFLFGTATKNLSATFPAPASTSAAISTASTAMFTAATTTAANFSTSVPPTVFSFGSAYSTAPTTSTAETANTTATTSPFAAITTTTTTTTGSSLFGFSSPAATLTITASQSPGSFFNITNGSQTNTLASSSGTLFGSSPSFDIGSLGPTSETKSGNSASGPTTSIFGSTWQQPQNSSTSSSVFAFGASPTPTPSFVTGGATSSSFAGPPFFGAVTTSPNNNNDDQMSMEDSMAEDSMQTQSPVSLFGQASVGAPGFVFSSTTTPAPTQTLTPTVVPFQFGGQSNQATAPQNLFLSSSFNGGGGSFSLGSGGEKSSRRIVRVVKSKK